ncbi:MAG: GAF domain-containing protein [Trichodesmium sp. St17_bin3_1_1]|nr:GAF domain-containing protein [Trichodesmium sp. St17_bin3_1_1]
MSNSDNQYLLMLGAYRDNEVSSTHPLVNTLDKIKQGKVVVNEISLSPLKFSHINKLIADTLSCSSEISKPLAELIRKKTHGNPFFLTQLLYYLYQENFLVFQFPQSLINTENNQKCYWKWDIEEIKRVSITDNVVELMVSKIEKLEVKTQKILKLAACIGNQFNLEILSIINRKSQTITAQELEYAIQEGLINPLDNNYKIILLWDAKELSNELSENYSESAKYIPYKFLHDRVQQAAYSLIPEDDKKQLHLQIGRLLLRNIGEDELEKKIFDIVNQLNEGSALITEQSEKYELAKLNLQAGKKAKASTAYESSLRYLETGLEALEEDSWQHQYQLTLELHVETLESLYLNTKWEQIEELSATILQKGQNILDKVKVYELMILSYFAQFQPQKAIGTADEALAKLGISISQGVVGESEIKKRIKQGHESLKLLLKGKKIAELADLPELTDPYKLAAISILQQVMTSIWTTNTSFLVEIILTQLNLYFKDNNYKNSLQAAGTYACYGMLLCGVMGDIDSGYQFGKLSITLLEKYNITKLESLVMHLFYGFIWHWRESINGKVGKEKLLNSIQQGINVGNNEYVSYICIDYCFVRFFGGVNLEQVEKDYREYTTLIKNIDIEYSIHYIEICKNIIANLRNGSQDTYHLLLGNSQDEEDKYLEIYKNQNNLYLLFIYYFSKTLFSYFCKDYFMAFNNSQEAEKYVMGITGFIPTPQHNFYFSLSLIAYYNNANTKQQKELLEQVDKNQDSMKIWSQYCPENFQHKYDLVEAEKARILGQNWQAEEFYEKAIKGAKKYEFIHEEALAYERASEFYFAFGREEIGQFYLKNAYYCYIRWGAKAKVKQLESEYPQYLLGITNPNKFQGLSARISTTGNGGEILDLTTVIKASQAISGEIQLENLLHNLMKILIENAGAQIGFLILNYQGSWVIEAQGKIDSNQVNILQSIPIEFVDPETSIPVLPTTIINYVLRTQENIVLKDATHQGQFINDPYIIARQNKSILCTPLINQGQLRGIIYLENNLTTGVFTSKRVELLNILSAQAAISVDNSRLYSQVMENQAWLDQLNKAYERFVPKQFLEFLDKESIVDVELGDQVQLEMSVLFSDVRNFTTMSEAMTPDENFRFINSFLSRMEPAILENQGFIDKYIGDAIMALFSGDADNAVKAGISMLKRLRQYNQYRASSGDSPVRIGIGINTGLLMLGTVGGQNRMDGTVIGDAVNLGARVESLTKNYGVSLLITEQTFSRLTQPNNHAIRPIDTVKVKGKSQKVTVYEVFDVDPPVVKEGKLNTLQRFQQAIFLYNSGQLLEAREMFAECLKLNPRDQVAQIYLQRILSTGE